MKVLDKGYANLVDCMGNDVTIVNAARVSFDKRVNYISRQDINLVRYLLQNKHTSPFEHVVFTFEIKSPLFVARQWMRHRTWSFNEISRRYTSENIDFYIPTELRKQAESNRQASTDETIKMVRGVDGYPLQPVSELMEYTTTHLLRIYHRLLEDGVAREQARMVLPQNMYTTFYGTVDLHNLLHFLELRNSEHAQYEIRLYAQALEELITPYVQETLKAWKELNP